MVAAMPIDESWTVKPAPGCKRLSGAEILEAAARLSRYHPEAAADADVRVVTGWGGSVKRLEVTVPELDAEHVYPRAEVADDTLMLSRGAAEPGPAPWFRDGQ